MKGGDSDTKLTATIKQFPKFNSKNDDPVIQEDLKQAWAKLKAEQEQQESEPVSTPEIVRKNSEAVRAELDRMAFESYEENIVYILKHLERRERKDGKPGAPISCANNYSLVFSGDYHFGGFKYDIFNRRMIYIGDMMNWHQAEDFKNGQHYVADVDIMGFNNYLDSTYKLRNKQKFIECLEVLAKMNPYHPVREYIYGLPEHDGVPRAEQYFCDGLAVENTEYARAITRCWLIGAIARVFVPGCKFDYTLIIKGEQGIGKSTHFRRLGKDWFNDSITSVDGKDVLQQLTGSWIIELGELQATKRSDNENIKAFLSRQVDDFRKPYARLPEEHPRQCVFCGTTNSETFLRDLTGSRRFLVLEAKAAPDDTAERLHMPDGYIDKVWAEVWHWFKELFPDCFDEFGNFAYPSKFDESKLDLPENIKKMAANVQAQYAEGGDIEAQITNFLETKIPAPEIWNKLPKKARRDFINGDIKFYDGTNLTGEVYRDKVCAAEIVYEGFNLDYPAKERTIVRQVLEIMSKQPNWQRANSGIRIDGYGIQKTAFIRKKSNNEK